MNFTGDRLRGFTLTEAMITVTIIAIMGSMAVIGFRKQQPKYLFDRQVKMLHADLCAAHMSAIGKSCRVTVAFDSTNGLYSIWTDSDDNGVRGEGETVVQHLDPAQKISLSAVPARGSFAPSGRFGDDQGDCSIVLASPLCGRREIKIFKSGHVRMSEKAGAGELSKDSAE